jgi:hypothetical protein
VVGWKKDPTCLSSLVLFFSKAFSLLPFPPFLGKDQCGDPFLNSCYQLILHALDFLLVPPDLLMVGSLMFLKPKPGVWILVGYPLLRGTILSQGRTEWSSSPSFQQCLWQFGIFGSAVLMLLAFHLLLNYVLWGGAISKFISPKWFCAITILVCLTKYSFVPGASCWLREGGGVDWTWDIGS